MLIGKTNQELRIKTEIIDNKIKVHNISLCKLQEQNR